MDDQFYFRYFYCGNRGVFVTFKNLNKFLAVFRQHSESKTEKLLDSVGEEEMMQVRRANDINFHWWDFLIAWAFAYSIYIMSYIGWLVMKNRLQRLVCEHLKVLRKSQK